MELNEKQKKILEFLEKEELATTKIAFLISANLYQAEEYLNELEKEGFISDTKICCFISISGSC